MSTRSALVLLAAAILAPAVAAEDAEDFLARNVEFLLAGLGFDRVPEGDATMHANAASVALPARDALHAAAERARGVDLAALAAAAADDDVAYGVYDTWIIEFSDDPCPEVHHYMPTPLPNARGHEQFWAYAGGLGYQSTAGSGHDGIIVAWTLKESGRYVDGASILGQSDFFCVEIWGRTLWFPYLDGVAWAHDLDAPT